MKKCEPPKCPETVTVDMSFETLLYVEDGMLKPISVKRQKKLSLRRELVAKIMAENPVCKAKDMGLGDCWGPLDVDEITLRSQLKDAELIEDNCQVLCRKHHQWKHENPSKARELGLYRSVWEEK